VDGRSEGGNLSAVVLGPGSGEASARRGERIFHDARFSHQQWQSCASCHPDGRADALNWDLLNDGIGNPKNTKSLVLSHKTPPVMSLGVRATAEQAVRTGFRNILFHAVKEEEASAVDEYLRTLEPVPSPLLVGGELSEAAQRGKRLFSDPQVGCVQCHPPPLFTDLRPYDVGTATGRDGRRRAYDTPTLIEVWRTAPYLHDGSITGLEALLTEGNRQDRHGRTSHLSADQIRDLAHYVLSL
jgi:cytochrome c peroxidase